MKNKDVLIPLPIDEYTFDTVYMKLADYKKMKKDLEVLELIKKNPELVWWCCCYENAYQMIDDRKGFMLDYSMEEIIEQFNTVKEYLER